MLNLGQAELELAQARAAAAEAKAALAAAKADGPSSPGGGVPSTAAPPGPPGAWHMADGCGSWLADVAKSVQQFGWNCGSPTHTVQDPQISPDTHDQS